MVWKNICKIIIALTIVLFAGGAVSADDHSIMPQVDERSELLSIVFQLAGCFEYNQTWIESYRNDIKKYFAQYRKDPVVTLAKKLRRTASLGFAAPMKMAVSLSSPPSLVPVVAVTQDPEHEWTEKSASEFTDKLRKFYIRSKFHDFYTAHEGLYNLAESRFCDLSGKFDQSWCNKLFGGGSAPKFNLLLNLANGPNNYGAAFVYPDGHKEIFAIVGCRETDKSGNPNFTLDDLTRVVHEFNHSYVNPLVEAHSKELACAKPVFDAVAESMSGQAYPDCNVMLCEALVRASVIMYMEAAGADARQIRNKILEEQSRGFVWIDELCELLRQYQSERSRYPTLDAFMAKIVEFYKGLAPRIKEKLAAYDNHCPHVVGTEPVHNHSDSVDAGISEIIVHFDKALDSQYNQAIPTRAGQSHFPVVKSEFLPGNKSLKLTVKLKNHWNYEMRLSPFYFRAPDGYRLVDYKLVFKTK